MTISHYGGMIGYHNNPKAKFYKSDLAVGCSACGASKGSKCRDRYGVVLTKTHSVRKKSANLEKSLAL